MSRTGPRDAAVTSKIMARVGQKDGKAELLLRHALYHRGIRYRKNYKRLPGSPDVAIPWARVAVFVDGDFWHGNMWRLRGLHDLAALFPTNTEFWVAKVTRNMARDQKDTDELRRMGWKVLRYWESEILRDTDRIAAEVSETLEVIRSG